jgi:hypothetical protein
MAESRGFNVVHLIATAMVAAGLAATVLGPLVLLVELFEWITRSEWPGLTVADGLSLFGVVHEEAETESQRLQDVLMALPLSVALYFTGLFTFFSGINIGDWGQARDLEAQFLSDD